MQNIDQYIEAEFNHVILEEDYKELQNWITAKEENRCYYEAKKQHLEVKLMEQIKGRVSNNWDKLSQKIESPKVSARTNKVLPLVRKYFIYAAALLLVSSIFFNVYALLTKKEQKVMARSMTEFYVPAGSRTAEVTLSDGTKVMLNPGSRISYPSSFQDNRREVTVSGEAFFNVCRDEEKPFVVHVGKQEIRVLGTSFIVDAYDELDYIKTTLISGSVELCFKKDDGECTKILEPQESCLYDKKSESVKLIPKEFYNPSLVSTDTYKFKDTSLKEICAKLNLIFDVEIVLSADIAGEVYTGTISLKEPITQALKLLNYKEEFSIQRINATKYELKRKTS